MAKRLRGIPQIVPHYPPGEDKGPHGPWLWYGDDAVNAADGPWYDAPPGSMYLKVGTSTGGTYSKIADTGAFSDWIGVGGGGASVTQANGAAAAGQKVVTVDSTTGFLGGCFVEYALATGVIERNTVATVDSATQVTLTTNIGAGGIANDALIAVIPVSSYNVQHTRLNAVYCFGDSLSENPAYNTQLQSELGSTWVVLSAGIGGNTTTQMAARLATDVTNAGDAEYVVVLGGINDVARDVAAATIETNLQTIYTALAAAGAKVIALTITPFKTNASWSAGRQTVLDAVNTWILATATDVDYTLDAYDLLEDGVSDTLQAAYDSGDHLHLSVAGYAALGTAIFGAATWTPATTPTAISVSGPALALNQSLRTTDDVTFANLRVSRLLDMPIWRPQADSTTALKITDTDETAIVTFDTDNLTVGIGAAPTTDTKLYLYHSSASTLYGEKLLAVVVDATGTVDNRGLAITPYNYAIAADSAVAIQTGLAIQNSVTAHAARTASVVSLSGITIDSPLLNGDGTKAVTNNFGIALANQGATGITSCYGLYIEDQTGATNNWAVFTNAGKHQIGSSAATIGFYGVTPIAQAVLATGVGATVDNVITALQNLGLVKQA